MGYKLIQINKRMFTLLNFRVRLFKLTLVPDDNEWEALLDENGECILDQNTERILTTKTT